MWGQNLQFFYQMAVRNMREIKVLPTTKVTQDYYAQTLKTNTAKVLYYNCCKKISSRSA